MAAARDAPVVLGPPVSLVDTVSFDDAEALPGGVAGLLKDRLTPLLVTGLVHQWPLYDRWSFDRLARLKRCVSYRCLSQCRSTVGPVLVPDSSHCSAPVGTHTGRTGVPLKLASEVVLWNKGGLKRLSICL
jgi:hypothetical protein